MSAAAPPFGRVPSLDQQKGPVAARRHIPIQPINITTPSANTTPANTTTPPTRYPTSPPIVPIPYSADQAAGLHELPVDLGSVPASYPRSAEQRMTQEGGVLASAADDLRVFAQPVPVDQQTNKHTSGDSRE